MYTFSSQIVQQIANVILYISKKSTIGYEIVCTAYGIITLFSAMGDVISIVFITIDRYIHIHHPLKYEMILTMKRVKIMCAICLVVTCTFSIVQLSPNHLNPMVPVCPWWYSMVISYSTTRNHCQLL